MQRSDARKRDAEEALADAEAKVIYRHMSAAMSTLAEVLAQGIRIHDGSHDKGAAALGDDLAAVVADWLTTDEAVEVVGRALRSEERTASGGEVDWGEWEEAGEEERGAYRYLAREQLAALAVHAKGEAP